MKWNDDEENKEDENKEDEDKKSKDEKIIASMPPRPQKIWF